MRSMGKSARRNIDCMLSHDLQERATLQDLPNGIETIGTLESFFVRRPLATESDL